MDVERVHGVSEALHVPFLDGSVSGARIELTMLSSHGDAGDAVVVGWVERLRNSPGGGIPNLQGPIPGSGDHLEGRAEPRQSEHSAKVGGVKAGHGLECRKVPDANRSVFRAGHEHVGALENEHSVHAPSVAQQGLHCREGLQAPHSDGPVLGARAKHLLGVARVEALDEAPMPRQGTNILQVVQVPDHDVAVLGPREEDVPHAAQAKHGAHVTSQDMDAVLLGCALVSSGRDASPNRSMQCAAARAGRGLLPGRRLVPALPLPPKVKRSANGRVAW
mmetsp:Transcript_56966/g.133229  ORF Transcript_56966/g.133229 Transcript_56966/m.133229 type:complete len:277 (-) Transcript_56966:610-1440(-)